MGVRSFFLYVDTQYERFLTFFESRRGNDQFHNRKGSEKVLEKFQKR